MSSRTVSYRISNFPINRVHYLVFHNMLIWSIISNGVKYQMLLIGLGKYLLEFPLCQDTELLYQLAQGKRVPLNAFP